MLPMINLNMTQGPFGNNVYYDEFDQNVQSYRGRTVSGQEIFASFPHSHPPWKKKKNEIAMFGGLPVVEYVSFNLISRLSGYWLNDFRNGKHLV